MSKALEGYQGTWTDIWIPGRISGYLEGNPTTLVRFLTRGFLYKYINVGGLITIDLSKSTVNTVKYYDNTLHTKVSQNIKVYYKIEKQTNLSHAGRNSYHQKLPKITKMQLSYSIMEEYFLRQVYTIVMSQ